MGRFLRGSSVPTDSTYGRRRLYWLRTRAISAAPEGRQLGCGAPGSMTTRCSGTESIETTSRREASDTVPTAAADCETMGSSARTSSRLRVLKNSGVRISARSWTMLR